VHNRVIHSTDSNARRAFWRLAVSTPHGRMETVSLPLLFLQNF